MTVSEAALARHDQAMRRQGRIYTAVVVAVVLATIVIAAFVYAAGEANNTVLKTAANPPANLAIATPRPTLSAAWRSTDQAAGGMPVTLGTVVTFDEHTVRGRDARTGNTTWSYYRSNRSLCGAWSAIDPTKDTGVTVAVYRVNGNCDELTALETQTGQRRWTRTLDIDGHQTNGTPDFSITPYTLMVTTPTVIYAVALKEGTDRWEFHQQNCTINGAVSGTYGALISQTCTKQQCNNKKLCGDGPQLLLRDAYAGRNDKDKKDNFDQLKWNKIGNTDVPVSADQVVTAINVTTHALDVLNSGTGKNIASLVLSPSPADVTSSAALSTVDNEFIWFGGTTYVLNLKAKIVWTAPSVGPPSIASPASKDFPLPTSGLRLTQLAATGIATLEPTAGGVLHTSTAAGAKAEAGMVAYPLGAGFLVAGPDGTVAYQ